MGNSNQCKNGKTTMQGSLTPLRDSRGNIVGHKLRKSPPKTFSVPYSMRKAIGLYKKPSERLQLLADIAEAGEE